jgi:hypothetical protein
MMNPRSKKILWRTITVSLLCAVATELLVRVYFSLKLGWVVLLYGIVESPHDVMFDPKGVVLRWDEKYANTAIHDNVFENYSKYYPNQSRIHLDESGKQIAATINSSGFRGGNFEKKKEPGVVRIVTLGASSTFGFKTRDDETYPYYLEEELNRTLASGSAVRGGQSISSSSPSISRYEVINLGIPHLQSDQIYSLFLAEAVPLEPDIVVFYEGYTDAAGSPRGDAVIQGVKRIPLVTTVFRELRHRLLTVALVANKAFGRPYDPLDAKVSGFQEEARVKSAQFVKNIESLNQECQKKGIRLIVANQQAQSLHLDREKIKGVSYAGKQICCGRSWWHPGESWHWRSIF